MINEVISCPECRENGGLHVDALSSFQKRDEGRSDRDGRTVLSCSCEQGHSFQIVILDHEGAIQISITP